MSTVISVSWCKGGAKRMLLGSTGASVLLKQNHTPYAPVSSVRCTLVRLNFTSLLKGVSVHIGSFERFYKSENCHHRWYGARCIRRWSFAVVCKKIIIEEFYSFL